MLEAVHVPQSEDEVGLPLGVVRPGEMVGHAIGVRLGHVPLDANSRGGDEVHRGRKVGECVENPGRELGAGPSEGIVIIEAIGVIARGHHLRIEAVRATGQPLDDIVDLFPVQELLDPGVNRRHSHLHGPSCLASRTGRAGRPGASGPPGTPDPGKPENNPATWAPQVGQVPWPQHEVPFR